MRIDATRRDAIIHAIEHIAKHYEIKFETIAKLAHAERLARENKRRGR